MINTWQSCVPTQMLKKVCPDRPPIAANDARLRIAMKCYLPLAVFAFCAAGVLTSGFSGEPAASHPPAASAAHLDALIRQLGDAQYRNRMAAQDELRRSGSPALGKLIAALTNDDPEIAFRTRELLGPYEKVLELMDAMSADGHTEFYYDTLTPIQMELVKLGPMALPFLRQRLEKEKDYLWRFNCVSVLNEIRCEESVPLLRSALQDPHPWVRGEAVWALGNTQDTNNLDVVAGLLRSEKDATARKEALLATAALAGITVFERGNAEEWAMAGSRSLTDETATLLETTVNQFLKTGKLPDAPRFEGPYVSHARALDVPVELTNEQREGDWKVKLFRAPGRSALWILSR